MGTRDYYRKDGSVTRQITTSYKDINGKTHTEIRTTRLTAAEVEAERQKSIEEFNKFKKKMRISAIIFLISVVILIIGFSIAFAY